MEARRRQFLRDGLDAFTETMKTVAAQRGFDEAQTRFTAAKAEAAQELERIAKEGEQKQLAELVAAIEFYERTGQ
jgi:hypothetical protein